MDSDRAPVPLMHRDIAELRATFLQHPLRALLLGTLAVAFIMLPSVLWLGVSKLLG